MKRKYIKSTGRIKTYKYWRCSHKSKIVELMIGKVNKDYKLLSEEEFEKQKLDLSYKRDALTQQIQNLNKRQDYVIDEVRTSLEFCNSLIDRFNSGSIEKKKEILLTLGRTIKLRDKKLYISPEKPFLSIKKIKKFTTTYSDWVELNPYGNNKGNKAFELVSLYWRDRRDSNSQPLA